MYTGSKPRRQSDKLLATICASFRLARVQADGGTVGACGHEVDTKRDERSTGVFLGEHLRSELLDGLFRGLPELPLGRADDGDACGEVGEHVSLQAALDQ